MKFTTKTVAVGSYEYSHPNWGISVTVEVFKDKTGELSVRFRKGYDGVLMKNISDTAIFEEVVK